MTRHSHDNTQHHRRRSINISSIRNTIIMYPGLEIYISRQWTIGPPEPWKSGGPAKFSVGLDGGQLSMVL